MIRTPLPLRTLTEHLKQNKPFSLSRWGDGELAAMFSNNIINADGVKLDRGLGKQLKAVLRQNNPYYHGLLRIGIKAYSKQLELTYKDFQWHNGDKLLHEFLKGKGKPFIEQLRTKRILYVGPNHCRQIPFFDYVDYIEVGSQAHKDSKVDSILRSVRKHNIELIGYSAGPASNIWINTIYNELKETATQVDFGSLFDGFLGIRSRSYMHNINFEELKELYAS